MIPLLSRTASSGSFLQLTPRIAPWGSPTYISLIRSCYGVPEINLRQKLSITADVVDGHSRGPRPRSSRRLKGFRSSIVGTYLFFVTRKYVFLINIKVFVHYVVSCHERKRNVFSLLPDQIRYPLLIREGSHRDAIYITVNISLNSNLPLNIT